MVGLTAMGWTEEEVVQIFASQLEKSYDEDCSLEEPGVETEDFAQEVSDSFFRLLLAQPSVNPYVSEFLKRRIVRWAATESPGLTVDVRRASSREVASRLEALGDGTVYDDEERVYTLSRFLRDVDAMAKFGFTPGFVSFIEKVSFDRPVEAAKLAEKGFAARGFPNVKIKVGTYVRNVRRCEQVVRNFSLGTRAIPAVSSEVVGETLLMYYTDERGEALWTVSGKIKYAESINHLYRACVQFGPAQTCLVLGLELEVLNLSVWDGVRNEFYSYVVDLHVAQEGIEPLEPGEDGVEGLTVEQRTHFSRIAEHVQPVCVDDKIVASAIQMTDKHALLCEHVITQSEGKDLRIGDGGYVPIKVIAPDVWVVESQRPMLSPWRLRECSTGEKAVYVYRVAGGLEVTDVVSVISTDGRVIATGIPDQARYGMSGAALVALSDFALLGVYRGASERRCVATTLMPEHYAKLGGLSGTRSVVSVGDEHYGDSVIRKLEKRGYGPMVRGVFSCIEPLMIDGKHHANGVCMAAHTAEGMRTFVVAPSPPEWGSYRLVGGAPASVSRADMGRCLVEAPFGKKIVPVMRAPELDERVLLLGKSPDGAYVTRPTSITRVGVDKDRFTVGYVEEDATLLGCVVLSWDDACVLGQVVATETRKGKLAGLACAGAYKMPYGDDASVLVKRLAEALSDVVTPMLWNASVLMKVFTQPDGKDEMLSFAAIGDAHAKSFAVRALRDQRVPYRYWTQISSITLSNTSWSRVCDRLRLLELVRYGSGVSPPGPSSKRAADLVEAIIGMALCYEGPAVADRLCDFFGAADIPPQFAEPVVAAISQAGAASVPVSPAVRMQDTWRSSWHGGYAVAQSGLRISTDVVRPRSVSPSVTSAGSGEDRHYRSLVVGYGRRGSSVSPELQRDGVV